MINSYVALDLETTGIDPSRDKIIEIGMARVIDGKITDTYSQLFDPHVRLNDRIVNLTGISNEMLNGMPDINENINEIMDFIGELPLLGHNIIFDYSFLKKAAVNNSMTFEKNGIDTLKIARRLLNNLEHKNLEYLCRYFEIDPGDSHRALSDALSARKLYERLYSINPDDTGFKETVQLNYSVKNDTPITAAQKRYLGSLTAYYNVKLEKEIDVLTKSEASRIIDGIISEYGKMPYSNRKN